MENHSLVYISYLKSIILKRKRNIQDKSRKNPLHLSSCIINLKFFLYIFYGLRRERRNIVIYDQNISLYCLYKWCKNVVQNTWEQMRKKNYFMSYFIVDCFYKVWLHVMYLLFKYLTINWDKREANRIAFYFYSIAFSWCICKLYVFWSFIFSVS